MALARICRFSRRRLRHESNETVRCRGVNITIIAGKPRLDRHDPPRACQGSGYAGTIRTWRGLAWHRRQAMVAEGLITTSSTYSAKETMDRLEDEVKGRGMKVFARI